MRPYHGFGRHLGGYAKCRNIKPLNIKLKLWLVAFVCGHMPQILAFSSSLITLKFSIHNYFKIRYLTSKFHTNALISSHFKLPRSIARSLLLVRNGYIDVTWQAFSWGAAYLNNRYQIINVGMIGHASCEDTGTLGGTVACYPGKFRNLRSSNSLKM